MSMFSNFLHPERAYKAAQDMMQQYYNQAQNNYQPYMQQGQAAYQPMSAAMQKLLDPTALQSEWMNSYETSPQAEQAMAKAKEQGLGAASSMGLMGSSAALRGIEGKAGEINAADRQSYLNDLMQKYIQGTGLAQNIYGTGANMAGQAGTNAMNMGQMMGQAAYGQNSAQGNLFGNLLGTGASLLGGYLTGRNNNYQPWNQTGVQ